MLTTDVSPQLLSYHRFGFYGTQLYCFGSISPLSHASFPAAEGSCALRKEQEKHSLHTTDSSAQTDKQTHLAVSHWTSRGEESEIFLSGGGGDQTWSCVWRWFLHSLLDCRGDWFGFFFFLFCFWFAKQCNDSFTRPSFFAPKPSWWKHAWLVFQFVFFRFYKTFK